MRRRRESRQTQQAPEIRSDGDAAHVKTPSSRQQRDAARVYEREKEYRFRQLSFTMSSRQRNLSQIYRAEAESRVSDDTRVEIMFDRLMLTDLRENVKKLDKSVFAELHNYKVWR